MKKILLTLFLALGVIVSASAQKEREKGVYNKKGFMVLPQEGDFAIGVDANPFLNYAASLFNRNGIDSPSFDGFKGSLYGKYFLRDNQAIRVKLFFDFGSSTRKHEVRDDVAAYADPYTEAKVTDMMRIGESLFQLSAGYEWRRGYGRLQGFVGGEAGFVVGSGSTVYEWGNSIDIANTAPTSTNWPLGTYFPSSPASSRTLKSKDGMEFGFQVGGFAGVEYFFARKMSVGAELGVNLRMATTGKGSSESEFWDTTKSKRDTKENKGTYSENFKQIQTPVTGNIFLMFHF